MDVVCEGVRLRDLLKTCALHNLPEGVTLQSMFLSHGGVMCQSKQLGNVGDFVQLSSTEVSILYHIFVIII